MIVFKYGFTVGHLQKKNMFHILFKNLANTHMPQIKFQVLQTVNFRTQYKHDNFSKKANCHENVILRPVKRYFIAIQVIIVIKTLILQIRNSISFRFRTSKKQRDDK